MIAGIEAYERAGVEHIVLALNSGDLAHITGLMVHIAQKVDAALPARPGLLTGAPSVGTRSLSGETRLER